jgi:hypothetical protein
LWRKKIAEAKVQSTQALCTIKAVDSKSSVNLSEVSLGSQTAEEEAVPGILFFVFLESIPKTHLDFVVLMQMKTLI